MLRRTLSKKAPFPPCEFTPKPYTGLSTKEVLAKRAKYMLGAFVPLYKEPLHLVEGHSQWLWDASGDRYLDFFGGIVTVGCGHSHPRIAARVSEIATSLNHTSMAYVNNIVGDYCEALSGKLPKDSDWCIHMTSSGSEATDFAMIVSRNFTQKHHVFCIRNGYHGMGEGPRGLTSLKGWKHALHGPAGIVRTVTPHPFWGKYGTDPKDVDKYIADLESQIMEETPGKIAGMFIEAFQGAGGCAPLLPGYMRRAFDVVKKHGGMRIADEVQTGFGRTGKKFWGFELDDAQPDIVTMAKSAGNGWPVGICAIRKDVADSMNGVGIVNTYGGNAMSAAVAHEVLKIIEEEKLQENCLNIGGYLKGKLEALSAKHPALAQVRGEGLMLGMELVVPGTNTPNPALTVAVMEQCKADKVLIGKGGPSGNVIRLSPPMCVTKADADYFVDVLDNAFTKEGM